MKLATWCRKSVKKFVDGSDGGLSLDCANLLQFMQKVDVGNRGGRNWSSSAGNVSSKLLMRDLEAGETGILVSVYDDLRSLMGGK